MLVSSKPDNLELNMKLLDVCDGLTHEQLRCRQVQQDESVWSARERVFSAKSRENMSYRTRSRLSSVTDKRDDDQRSVTEYSQDVASIRNSPDPYTESIRHSVNMSPRGQYAYIPKAQTLPDIEMRKAQQQLMFEDQGGGSYSSINNGLVIPKRKLCSRSKSAMVSRYSDRNYLSRQCCDVLGPKVCRDCALIKRKIFDSYRFERPLSRLEVSEKNFADSIVLRRSLPELHADEIEDKVISGEILRASLRQRLLLKRERTLLENSKSKPAKIKERPKSSWNGVSSTFFMDIRDLNNKILIGKLTNRLHNFQNPNQNNKKPEDSKSKALVPVTPNVKDKESKPKRMLHYEPPLVPKICQNSEPAFYAGSSEGYQLPDRLPDKVIEDQIDDFSAFEAAWSQSGSSRTQSESEKILETGDNIIHVEQESKDQVSEPAKTTNNKLESIEQSPELTSNKPESMEQSPESTNNNLETVEQSPESTSNKPESMEQSLESTNNEPETMEQPLESTDKTPKV